MISEMEGEGTLDCQNISSPEQKFLRRKEVSYSSSFGKYMVDVRWHCACAKKMMTAMMNLRLSFQQEED